MSSEETSVVDLLQTNGQVASRAYVYKVTHADTWFHIVVISQNSTSAKIGLLQRFPGAVTAFIGVAEQIMQVNG